MNLRWGRLVLASVITWIMAIGTSAYAKPTNTSESLADRNKADLQALLENPMDPHQALFLASLAGANQSSLKALQVDFKKRKWTSPVTGLTLQKDQIFYQGAATGIRFTSYSPLNLEYKGQVWTYDKSKSLDQNFFQLSALLETGKKGHGTASLWISRWISGAHAQSSLDEGIDLKADEKSYATNGTIAGAITGAVVIGIVALFSPISVPVMGVATAGGAVVGAVSGYFSGDALGKRKDKMDNALVDTILSPGFKIECTADTVSVFGGGANKNTLIRIHTAELGFKVDVFRQSGTPINNEHISMSQRAKIVLLKNCKNESEAAVLTQKFIATAQSVRNVEASSDKAPAPAGASGIQEGN